jgi:hypothetical protein
VGRSGSSVVGPAVSRYRPGETGGVGQVIAGERKPVEEWRPFEVVQFLERLLREDAEETRSARRKAVNKSAMTGVFLRVGHPIQHLKEPISMRVDSTIVSGELESALLKYIQ